MNAERAMGEGSSRWSIQAIADAARRETTAFISERWYTPRIVTRARIHDAATLAGMLVRDQSRLAGVVTYSLEVPECEIVTLDVADDLQRRGVGGALLGAVERVAREQGCDRTWLVTTNDNLTALGFYQRQGYRILAVHPDAVVRSREIKPEIPERAANGILVLDELELEKVLL